MPKATLAAVETFEGAIADTVRSRYGEAKLVVERLARVGVDLADVADVLERQGVASFAESWDELVKSVEEQLENAGADVMPAGAVIPKAVVPQTPPQRRRLLEQHAQSGQRDRQSRSSHSLHCRGKFDRLVPAVT
jgi:hypothetical protein